MRRVATVLSLVALLCAGAASAYLVTAPMYGTASSSSESGELVLSSRTLVEVNGPWVIMVVAFVTMVASAPFVLALVAPSAQRAITWLTAVLLLAFSVVAGFSIGLFFMPSALALLAAAIATVFVKHEPEASSRDRGAL